MDRYYKAAIKYSADYIVRVTSDCPLIDPNLIDKVIDFTINENLDYGSNVLLHNYPDGQDIEVFKFDALKSAWEKAKNISEREHVTPYIYNNPNLFKIKMVEELVDYSDSYFTIDYESDLKIIEEIAFSLDNIFEFDMIELYRLFKKLKFSHKLLNHNKKAIIEKINYE